MYQLCKHGKQDGEPCEECSFIVKAQMAEAEIKYRFKIARELQDWIWNKCDHDVSPVQNYHCCKQCAINFIMHKLGKGTSCAQDIGPEQPTTAASQNLQS